MFEKSGTKYTEAKIKAAIETNPIYEGLKTKLISVEEELFIAQALKDSFYHRKDMLVTLGANMRAELDAEIRINKKGL